MTQTLLKDRIFAGRDSAEAKVVALSQSAREAAAVARERVEHSYGNARSRVSALADDGRALVSDGAEVGSRAMASGRKVMDRALYSSRDLIAERPVTAVVVGLTAGVVLGFLANQLARQRKNARAADAEDAFIGG